MRTVGTVVDAVWILNFEHLALEMSQLFSTELRNIQIDVTQKLPKEEACTVRDALQTVLTALL